jgi:hypothetical protein
MQYYMLCSIFHTVEVLVNSIVWSYLTYFIVFLYSFTCFWLNVLVLLVPFVPS